MPETSIQRQNRLKPDEIDELVRLYESGLSVRELADQVKIHRTTVMAHLKRRGVETRPDVRKLIDQQVHSAVERYQEGLSLEAVGRELGASAETIRNELMRLGVARRKRRGRDGS